ncbi:MAG: carotenoid biosynthesis protein [Flavobacteriales bacterium]
MNVLVRYRYWVIAWLVLVHVSGAVGLLLAPDFFLAFTPFNLLLSAALVVASHERSSWVLPVGFLGAAFAGWFVEVVGVNTTYIFGDYLYGSSFGFQCVGVPLLIGLNWAVLVLAGLQVARHHLLIQSRWLAALSVSGMLLALDLLMEGVAPRLDFWTFYQGASPMTYPGIHNFVGWLVTGFVIAFIAHPYLSRGVNRMALFYLVLQGVFFIILNALFLIF